MSSRPSLKKASAFRRALIWTGCCHAFPSAQVNAAEEPPKFIPSRVDLKGNLAQAVAPSNLVIKWDNVSKWDIIPIATLTRSGSVLDGANKVDNVITKMTISCSLRLFDLF
jgi:hypothetical protein